MTAFTTTSPTAGGTVPEGVTEVGGLVIDLIGANGTRVISQAAASGLFTGFFSSNPGTIGTVSGFTESVVAALGEGLSEVAIRLTLFDGDTAPGNFDDDGENRLLLNGINVGTFDVVPTETTSDDGLTRFGTGLGFANEELDTGWFHITDAEVLAAFFESLASGKIVIGLEDDDPFDNFFDFTQGIDGTLLDVGSPPNVFPTPADDTAQTAEDTPVIIFVLDNDSDADEDALTVTNATDGARGTTTVNADGSITYVPDADANGTDTFDYTVSDGNGGFATATVTVTITPQNDAPVALADTAETNEDTPVTINVIANDRDIDGDGLFPRIKIHPELGDLTPNEDGSLTYTPEPGASGTDSFTYRASDGKLESNLVTVTITINAENDAPVAADDAFSGDEDSRIDGNVLLNDRDLEEDPLTVRLLKGPDAGTFSLDPGGDFRFTPPDDANGTFSFTYVAFDGALESEPAKVTITVHPRNDRPTTKPDRFAGTEDSDLSGNVLANDSDIDGDKLTARLIDDVSKGSLTLNSDGTFTYTPDENANGTDRFTYQAFDGDLRSRTETVTLDIAPVNDRPTARADAFSTPQNGGIEGNVLANDTDVDGDRLSAILVDDAENGTLSLSSNGTFTYTPDPGFFGTDTFTYKASDGEATSPRTTVTVDVTPTNTAPSATMDRFRGREDEPITGNPLANDGDADEDRLSIILMSDVENGTLNIQSDGTFIYTPDKDFSGTDLFTYRAFDGTNFSATRLVKLIVAPVNDKPTAQDDAFSGKEDTNITGDVLLNDADVDGSRLLAELSTGPSNGTLFLRKDGTFRYTPDPDFSGTDRFTYRASDGERSSTRATVELTVEEVNDAPVAEPDTFEGLEDRKLSGNVAKNDSDPDGDTFDIVLVDVPKHGELTLDANGRFVYVPDEDFAGTDRFKYRADDGTDKSRTTKVTLEIEQLSDKPIARRDKDFTVTSGETLNITQDALTANDSDGDRGVKEDLTIVAVGKAVGGTVSLTASGAIRFKADDGVAGTGSFRYTLEDSAGRKDTAKVLIDIEPERLFSDITLKYELDGETPALIYIEEGNATAASAQFLEIGDPFNSFPLSIAALDSDDGTLSDYPIDPGSFAGLFGPDFVDEARATSTGIAIVDGEDFSFADSANTIEGDEVLAISFDDTAVIGSAGSATVRLNDLTNGERVRARIYDDGELVGTFRSSGSTIEIDAPEGVTFDEVRLSAIGDADFTFGEITLFDVFERPVLEI